MTPTVDNREEIIQRFSEAMDSAIFHRSGGDLPSAMKDLRKNVLCMSQQALATRIGISLRALSNYEHGDRIPSGDILMGMVNLAIEQTEGEEESRYLSREEEEARKKFSTSMASAYRSGMILLPIDRARKEGWFVVTGIGDPRLYEWYLSSRCTATLNHAEHQHIHRVGMMRVLLAPADPKDILRMEEDIAWVREHS